ncbi:MAG: alpha/beta hydrolase [Gammaproteobacteria bacterium]|nr:alpha/beta hydrolase [Gammaproteobacteria bacterium]
MPLDPGYDDMLRQLAALGGPSLAEVPVEAGREMFRAMQVAAPEIEVAAVTDISAGGVPARVYRPDGDGPFPVVMMFHGGGWVIGDLATADSQSREICRGAGVVVVSVDYRLAPEHRFPAAAEDCYSATLWAAEHAGVHDGDPGSLAVAGDSAGGNLAAVVAQMARDRGGPPIAFQLLVYPVTDGVNFDRASYRDNAEGYLLTAEAMHWFWDHYAPTRNDRRHPYASPLLADDLSRLPPALVMTAEYDPLRDEGEDYARALANAGVDARFVRYDGFIHGFFAHTRTIIATREAMSDACAALRGAFNAA